MKDNTCMYTGIFGTIVVLFVTIVYAAVCSTSTASEILFGMMTAVLLDLACYLEHKTVNQKGENSIKDNTFKLIGIFATVMILFVVLLYATIRKMPTVSEILVTIMAIVLINLLCWLAHKNVNRKK